MRRETLSVLTLLASSSLLGVYAATQNDSAVAADPEVFSLMDRILSVKTPDEEEDAEDHDAAAEPVEKRDVVEARKIWHGKAFKQGPHLAKRNATVAAALEGVAIASNGTAAAVHRDNHHKPHNATSGIVVLSSGSLSAEEAVPTVAAVETVAHVLATAVDKGLPSYPPKMPYATGILGEKPTPTAWRPHPPTFAKLQKRNFAENLIAQIKLEKRQAPRAPVAVVYLL